jgi:hypothetical protein
MLDKWIASTGAAAMTVTTYWLGGATGFNPGLSIVPALVAGAAFGWLLWKSGAKALLIPAGGLMLGLVGTFAARLLGGGASFNAMFYFFFPTLAMCVVTFFVSALLLVLPKLRRHLLGGR